MRPAAAPPSRPAGTPPARAMRRSVHPGAPASARRVPNAPRRCGARRQVRDPGPRQSRLGAPGVRRIRERPHSLGIEVPARPRAAGSPPFRAVRRRRLRCARMYRQGSRGAASTPRSPYAGSRENPSVPDFFEQPVLNSPYEAPSRHWELDGDRQPTGSIEERRRPAHDNVRRGRRPLRRGPAVRTLRPHRGIARTGRRMARSPPEELAGHARDGAAARSLENARLPRLPPLLLPGRGRGDADLADRGGAQASRSQGARTAARAGARQRGRERRSLEGRAQARDGGRQDRRDGDDHRLADDQRGALPRQPALHARLPRRHPRHHDPRPAARAAAKRSGQLLLRARAGASGVPPHARSGAHRDHELPRLPPGANAKPFRGRPAPCWRGAEGRPGRSRRPRARCCSASCPS